MLSKIKSRVPLYWKLNMKYVLTGEKNGMTFSKQQPKIVVALAADYGNLGDVAITYAQTSMLQSLFPHHQLVSLYLNDWHDQIISLKKNINKQDIITIIGGGNMGNVYESFEEQRRNIIKWFPNNKIVSFPQTFDFTPDANGEKSLQKTIKCYSQHKDLHIFAREEKSYQSMKKHYSQNNVYLVPDIVLSLNKENPTFTREGITLCLRDDLEKKIAASQKQELISKIESSYHSVQVYDTHIGDDNYHKKQAETALNDIWAAFKKSKVVVTDRLHGMIFCAITGTPCMVLPNSNHKIAGTYSKWLSDLPYIKFVEGFDEQKILDGIQELYAIPMNQCKASNLLQQFQPLWNALKK